MVLFFVTVNVFYIYIRVIKIVKHKTIIYLLVHSSITMEIRESTGNKVPVCWNAFLWIATV